MTTMTIGESCVRWLKSGTIGVLCDHSLEIVPPRDGAALMLLKGWAPRGPDHGIRAHGVFRLLPSQSHDGRRELAELSAPEREAWLASLGLRAVDQDLGAYGPRMIAERIA